ncbi:MAG TPA: hypothetical protein PLZ86_03180 [bacterium]|nr:hypothetical protein [bacterium]
MRKLRSILLKIALGLYDVWVISALNFVMWRNHMWNSRRWTRAVKSPAGDPEGH